MCKPVHCDTRFGTERQRDESVARMDALLQELGYGR